VTAFTTGAFDLRFTIDANILVYSADPRHPVKRASATAIMEAAVGRDCRVTLQALAEFFATTTRKRLLPPAAAQRAIADWLTLFPQAIPVHSAALLSAAVAAGPSGFSFWDALLVTTAAHAGCLAVISEDMAPGATLAGTRIVRAFDAAGAVSAEARALLG